MNKTRFIWDFSMDFTVWALPMAIHIDYEKNWRGRNELLISTIFFCVGVELLIALPKKDKDEKTKN
jgi:hypothetical protein